MRWKGWRVHWWPPHCILPGSPCSVYRLLPGHGKTLRGEAEWMEGSLLSSTWAGHVALNMSYHFSGPQFPLQLNGVVIPILRWRDLVRCLVLSLQVSLPSRLLVLYPTPSSKSHPAHIQQNPNWEGCFVPDCESRIYYPSLWFPQKATQASRLPTTPHEWYPNITSLEAVPPSLDPILLSLLTVCSHESLTLLYHVTQYSNYYLHNYLFSPLRLCTLWRQGPHLSWSLPYCLVEHKGDQ